MFIIREVKKLTICNHAEAMGNTDITGKIIILKWQSRNKANTRNDLTLEQWRVNWIYMAKFTIFIFILKHKTSMKINNSVALEGG